MQRYNLFKSIHKGLRALLYDTALYLQQTEFCDRRQATSALEKISLVMAMFESHGYYQQHYVLPAVKRFEKELVDEFEEEHREEKELKNKLKNLVAIFLNSSSDLERNISGSALNKAYMDFLIFSLKHMAKEEIELNQLLWKNYNNREILSIEQEMIDSIPTAKLAVYGKWMIKGMSDGELIRWFGKVKEVAPEFLYQSLLTLTEIELPSSRWYKIEEAIGESVQAA